MSGDEENHGRSRSGRSDRLSATAAAIPTKAGELSVKCAACDTADLRRPKLLTSCLHPVCSECVRDLVTCEGTIKCPTCQNVTTPWPAGVNAVDALPDYFGWTKLAPAAAGTAKDDEPDLSCHRKTLSKRVCDECIPGQEGDAASFCRDCQAFLCQEHAQVHPRSRRTAAHKVDKLTEAGVHVPQEDLPRKKDHGHEDSGAAASSLPVCPLHSPRPLSKFCTQCRALLCERCLEVSGRCPKWSTRPWSTACREHKLKESIDYGEEERQKVRKQLHSPNTASTMVQARIRLGFIRQRIANTNSMNERVSAKITATADRLVELVRTKERYLLETVDAACWQELNKLEEREREVSASLETAQHCSHLMAEGVENLSPVRFLQVSDCLGKALDRCKRRPWDTKNVYQLVMWFESDGSAIEDAIGSGLGRLVAANACPLEGSAELSRQEVHCMEEVEIIVTFPVDNDCFRPVDPEDRDSDEEDLGLPRQNVDFVLETIRAYIQKASKLTTSPSRRATELKFECSREYLNESWSRRLRAVFVPQEVGEYTITVQMDGCDMTEKPLGLTVKPA